MIRIALTLLAVITTGFAALQPVTLLGQSASPSIKHYRLTFALSDPQTTHALQTFTVEVPVSSDHRGMAEAVQTSMLAGDPDSTIKANLKFSEVHISEKGLAGDIALRVDSIRAPLPGSTEQIHHNLTFNRQIDIELNKPTRITEEPRILSLKNGTAEHGGAPPTPNSQITLTITEI